MPKAITKGNKILYVEVRGGLWEKLKISAVQKKQTLRRLINDLLEKAMK